MYFFCSSELAWAHLGSSELFWTRLGSYEKIILIFVLDYEKNKCFFSARLSSCGLAWALMDSLGILWENYLNFHLKLWKKTSVFFQLAWAHVGSLELLWIHLSSYGLAWALMGKLFNFHLRFWRRKKVCFCSSLELRWPRLSSYGLTWALLGSLGLLCKILIDFHLKSC